MKENFRSCGFDSNLDHLLSTQEGGGSEYLPAFLTFCPRSPNMLFVLYPQFSARTPEH